MPPKKKQVTEEPKPLLGRFGTSLSCGIVGVPNVGKSTFFNVLCNMEALAANYPFATIDPNESQVPVPDERFDFLVETHTPKSVIPAILKVWDIAGLVKGASTGEGLGNAFLSHINAVDGIIHMVRCFDDADVTHVDGTVDPVRDLETIHEELRIKDVEKLMKTLPELRKRVARSGKDKAAALALEYAEKFYQHLEVEKKDMRSGTWTAKEIEAANDYLFLSSKPAIYLVNLSGKDYIRKKNKYMMKVKTWIDARNPGDMMIPWSGEFEEQIREMEPEDRAKYLEENKVQSALPKIIKAAYKSLRLQYFFTAGPDEVRAWTIREGDKAPRAAGKIHTDFEKGFIMADVMKYTDFHEHKTENAVKAAGKYRQEGKNYVVADGDIIFFKFNN
ncbi:obg-like ATPase 1 [Sphaeroforma arctica JP610]|uniref:Obg-like ATPase 1 n=1 Tax=Sphaeroforma arctica JP610 TaxID=667725 RepID=A0A0L0GCS6_9EUKA|nr:obg-like ATPase 1 [Sphaeroforma arctica JP610]KNC86691.1 obg-like ATPase 1 [Sphaeroforma arctica JP610]|eukprot:XP_014160593.1 obg-like ATPase 1 [Sphaeroforma arctica JP610]